MASLVVAGITVSVAAASPPTRARDEGVDRARSVDGTMRQTLYYAARKRNWTVTTTPMLRADANALETALDGAPPLACSGDVLGGAVNCFAEITDWRAVTVVGGVPRVVLAFVLREA